MTILDANKTDPGLRKLNTFQNPVEPTQWNTYPAVTSHRYGNTMKP